MKTTSRYSYFCRETKSCIVFLHGLFSSKAMLEKLAHQLDNHSCLFINLFEITNDLERCDLDAVSGKIIQTLDELQISNSVFVSSCIGKSIAFCVGIQRPDLIKGQVFLGNIDEEIVPALKKARLDLFNYLKQKEKGKNIVSFLSLLVNIGNANDAEVYASELLKSIEQKSFENLYQNIHGKRHFSTSEYQRNNIPNVLILPNDSQANVSVRHKPGFNLSIVRVKGTSSEYGMISSKLFSTELKKSVTYLS